MSNIETAIQTALKAHKGQLDKTGAPYILHLMKLMIQCSDEQEMITCVIKDVINDSDITSYELVSHGFSHSIVEAVECLTRHDDESFEAFVERIANNEIARKIKIKEIRDNLDLTRLSYLSSRDLVNIGKYHEALNFFISLEISK